MHCLKTNSEPPGGAARSTGRSGVGAVIHKLGLDAENLPNLSAVDLTNRGVKASDVMALGPLLRASMILRSLKLGYNNLQDHGANAVAAALESQGSLVALDLGFNGIGDTGAAALGRSLVVNQTLQTLYLSGNAIGPAGAKSLAAGLIQNATLQVLHLTGNSLGASGASELSGALSKNKSLRKIYMSGSSIGRVGAEALAGALAPPTPMIHPMERKKNEAHWAPESLTTSFSCSPVGSVKSDESCTVPATDTFAYLTVYGMGRVDEARKDSRHASLINEPIVSHAAPGLECIYISDNDIGDQGVVAIANAMKTHHGLRILELGYV